GDSYRRNTTSFPTRRSSDLIGLGIALDDFGKGYSSFHYLQKYDVDTIKIDKMFIQQLDAADEKNKAIVRSIIQLAKALHIRVVADRKSTRLNSSHVSISYAV